MWDFFKLLIFLRALFATIIIIIIRQVDSRIIYLSTIYVSCKKQR